MNNVFSGLGNMFGGGCGCKKRQYDNDCGCGCNILWILAIIYIVCCTDILNCIDPCWLILLLLLILTCGCDKDDKHDRHDHFGC